jgi:UPF0042 nucleotide-binding protein
MNERDDRQVIVLVGHRGSGRTEAIRALEDLGVAGVDNLPPQLLPDLARIRYQECAVGDRHACVVSLDLGSATSVAAAQAALCSLGAMGVPYSVLALEVREATAVQRVLEKNNIPSHADAVVAGDLLLEKEALAPLYHLAEEILDTTNLSVPELRERLGLLIKGVSIHRTIHIDVHSFGFKYGPSLHADVLFDVRFISNPYYVAELRELNGKDKACADFVFAQPDAEFFVRHLTELLTTLAPSYSRLGKARLRVGIGCTGGQHRSVAIAERLSHDIAMQGFHVSVHHREMSRA